MSTPRADEALNAFRDLARDGLEGSTLMYHYTRMIELLNCLERAEALMKHDKICGKEIRITADPSREEGVGVIEAPRGTLVHHYQVDKHGSIRKVNLIVATGHNNIAMNRSVELVAKEYIHGGEVREGFLNRVEGAIRCYDPCLSCSTHALGQMPLHVQIFDHLQRLLRELKKD
jgi:NAD-reducing hydrogenase large subunit